MVTVTELNRAPNITVDAIDAASVSADALEADTLIGADVENATDRQIPTSQGNGALGMEAPPQNIPDVVEDGNSPLNSSGSQSATITLASSYDIVFVWVQLFENTSGGNQEMQLRVNGDTGTNYNYVDESGNLTTGASAFVFDTISNAASLEGTMTFGFGDNLIVDLEAMMSIIIPDMVVGDNRNVTAPLDSITFQGGSGTIDVKARVYGWNGGL